MRIIVVSWRCSEGNAILVQDPPSGFGIAELVIDRRVHTIADPNYSLDVSGEGRLARCQKDVFVVHDPLHHRAVVSTGSVRARFGKILRVGNYRDGEISARGCCRRGAY